MRRLQTRLSRAEVLLPAPPVVVLSPDGRRLAAFAERHPRYRELEVATKRLHATGPEDVGRLLDDPEWARLDRVITADFWRAEYAARALRGTPCHCHSFEHPACRPGAPSDLEHHQQLVVDFALWLVPANAEQLIADRPALLEFVGRQLNERSREPGPDGVAGMRGALTTKHGPQTVPDEVKDWATASFEAFVSAGGASDAGAWLKAIYDGEFQP